MPPRSSWELNQRIYAVLDSSTASPTDRVRGLIDLLNFYTTEGSEIRGGVIAQLIYKIATVIKEQPSDRRGALISLPTAHGCSVFTDVSRIVTNSLDSIDPKHLVQIVRSFAMVGFSDEKFIASITPILERCVPELGVEGRSHLAWAFATMNISAKPLFNKLAEAIRDTANTMPPAVIAKMMWALAKAEIRDWRVYAALCDRAKVFANSTEKSFSEHFGARGLINMAWAQAEAGYRDEALLSMMEGGLVEVAFQVRAQNIPHVLWSYAAIGVEARKLFETFVPRVRPHLEALSPIALVNLVWALSRNDIKDDKLLADIVKHIYPHIPDLYPSALANLAWGFSHLNYRDDKVFTKVSECSLRQIDHFNPQSMVNLLWAFGNVDIRDEQLFSSFKERITPMKDRLSGRMFTTIVWSFAPQHADLLEGLCSRDDLTRAVYDGPGWIQLYNSLLVAGLIDPSERFHHYERMVAACSVASPNTFEIDVKEAIGAMLANREHSIDGQAVVAGIFVDWCVLVDGKRYIIECDGDRYHLLTGPDGGVSPNGARWTAVGRDRVQDRVLELFGYNVTHVLASTFYSKNGEAPILTEQFRTSDR